MTMKKQTQKTVETIKHKGAFRKTFLLLNINQSLTRK